MTGKFVSPPLMAAIIPMAAMLVTGCDTGGGNAPAKSVAGSTIRAEFACDTKDMQAPLRRTMIIVDAKSLHKATNGVEFAERNGAFRDLVLSIADPAIALPAGTSVAREQITIAVIPADGSTAITSFTGCIPGMSPQELSAAQQKEGGVGSMFSSGIANQLEEQAETFRVQLIGGMVAAAALAADKASPQSGDPSASPFLAGLKASKGLLENDGRVLRLILISDLSGLDLPEGDMATARKAGIAAGRNAAADLSQSDVHIVLPEGRKTTGHDYFEAYWLAQGARMLSYAPAKVANTAPAPIKLWRFSGKAAYPSGPALTDIRIGDDGKGKLTSAWLTLPGTPSFAIPMTGSIVCSGDECAIQSDKGGFAQAWRETSGSEPEFRNDLPFGGMRSFEFKITGDRIAGRAWDDSVYIGNDQNQHSIAITGKAR